MNYQLNYNPIRNHEKPNITGLFRPISINLQTVKLGWLNIRKTDDCWKLDFKEKCNKIILYKIMKRRTFINNSILTAGALAAAPQLLSASAPQKNSMRPEASKRLFRSEAVEAEIVKIKKDRLSPRD